MSRPKRLLPLVVVVFGVLAGTARAQAPTLPADGGTRIESPTCSLRNVAGSAPTTLGRGDEFVLSGTKFPADVLVLVTLRQPPRAFELARFRTNAQGDFTSQPTILRIPAGVHDGPAAVHVASSGGSATCDLRVVGGATAASRAEPVGSTAADEDDGSVFAPWFIVWASLLAIGAGYLAYLRYRRWQEERLEKEISQLNTDPRRARVFKTDGRSTPKQVERPRAKARRLRLGDVKRSSPPPVLGPEDAATPLRQPPLRRD